MLFQDSWTDKWPGVERIATNFLLASQVTPKVQILKVWDLLWCFFWFVWGGLGRGVSAFVCFVVLFGFFSLGFLITEHLISVHKSNYWSNSIILAAAHIIWDKYTILIHLWSLKYLWLEAKRWTFGRKCFYLCNLDWKEQKIPKLSWDLKQIVVISRSYCNALLLSCWLGAVNLAS